MRYFASEFKETFFYEPKLNVSSNQNVECQIGISGINFNIEVKAASYDEKERIDSKNAFKIKSTGRYQNYHEISNFFKSILIKKDEETGEENRACDDRRMDNNLKDFLVLAQSKFPHFNNRSMCNILIVGCDDSDDVQDWYNYLMEHGGFFTKESYVPSENYNKTDILVLTNLYYKHNPKHDKRDELSWKFEEYFILCLPNPNAEIQKCEGIRTFTNAIPNYTKQYNRYEKYNGKNVPIMKLKHFIHKELGENNRIYHF